MNTLHNAKRVIHRVKDFIAKGVLFLYKTFIKPKSDDEDGKRHEFIFNVIVTTILCIIILLDAFILYAEATKEDYTGLHFTSFTFFIIFFGALLLLSRKGQTTLASYFLVGIFFFGATYGVYAWSIELPLSILSYSVIIVISSILLGTRASFLVTCVISATFIIFGYLQVGGSLDTDLSWRSKPLEWKDSFQASFFYFSIMVVSWLSNRDLEKSLRRARRSEVELKAERDLLEVRIEERTKELKAAQLEKVSQLYRFVEFGRLSSGIFHDLLNPLTTMSLSVEKLQTERGERSVESQELIDRAMRASKKVETFIQTARKQLDYEGKSEIFAIEDEVRDAIDLLLHKSRIAGVEVSADLATTTLVYGNSVKFFQVAANLISNAIDSYAGYENSKDKKVKVTIRNDASGIRFEIHDFGIGIPASIRDSIFESFFTTKSKKAGMGLGLSTTKSIVEKEFSGTIGFSSTEGAGSTFVVTIPSERKAQDRRRAKTGDRR